MRQGSRVGRLRTPLHIAAGFLALLNGMRKLLSFIQSRRAFRVAFATAATLTAISPAHAELETFKGEYTVYYLGLPIARSSFDSQVGSDAFSVKGTVSSAGIATIFDSTKGTATASGAFKGGVTQPSAFKMNYAEGKRKQMTTLGFKNGDVVSTENVPPLKKRSKKRWVPLDTNDLKGVLDPFSAGLIKASSPDEVCDRTIKLFDGEMRMNAVLRRRDTMPAAKEYGENVVTCRVKVKPVSGYRKGRRALDYLEKESKILVAFAPLGSTGVYAPVHATIGTEIGTVTVAVSYGKD
jgi:hypothetical protein